jgi:hypothetical protein
MSQQAGRPDLMRTSQSQQVVEALVPGMEGAQPPRVLPQPLRHSVQQPGNTVPVAKVEKGLQRQQRQLDHPAQRHCAHVVRQMLGTRVDDTAATCEEQLGQRTAGRA